MRRSRNTRDVIAFESWLGLPFEDNLQRWLLEHPTLIKMLNHYYIWFHFPAAIGLLLWLYLRHPNRYRGFRNLMAFVTFTALIIHLRVPAGAAADDDRVRRHDARVRPEHLPEERPRRCREPDRGDAIAALRVGDDRGDRGDQRAEVALAMARRRRIPW